MVVANDKVDGMFEGICPILRKYSGLAIIVLTHRTFMVPWGVLSRDQLITVINE